MNYKTIEGSAEDRFIEKKSEFIGYLRHTATEREALDFIAEIRAMHRKAYKSFPISRVYQAHIPTCPSGYWLFGFASKKYHPLKDLDPERWNKRGLKTWYYSTNLHAGAFMLPKYVEDLLKEEEGAEKK